MKHRYVLCQESLPSLTQMVSVYAETPEDAIAQLSKEHLGPLSAEELIPFIREHYTRSRRVQFGDHNTDEVVQRIRLSPAAKVVEDYGPAILKWIDFINHGDVEFWVWWRGVPTEVSERITRFDADGITVVDCCPPLTETYKFSYDNCYGSRLALLKAAVKNEEQEEHHRACARIAREKLERGQKIA